jgi:hypothetical protein
MRDYFSYPVRPDLVSGQFLEGVLAYVSLLEISWYVNEFSGIARYYVDLLSCGFWACSNFKKCLLWHCLVVIPPVQHAISRSSGDNSSTSSSGYRDKTRHTGHQ